MVEKYKIKTHSLVIEKDEVVLKPLKPLPLEKFCKPRSEIENEIAKRQTMWKRSLSSPPAEKKEEKQEADTSKKPPPTGFSTQASGEKENKQKVTTSDTSEEGLIYQTNFYLPDERWSKEIDTPDYRFFRQEYFHIELKGSTYAKMGLASISVTDFRVHVDIEHVKGEGKFVYGVGFRYIADGDKAFFYLFAVQPQSQHQPQPGHYALFFYDNKKWKSLIDYRPCEFIRNDGTNSLMMEMVGQQVKLGINGHILDTIEDNSLITGYTGVSLSKHDDLPLGIRCRNFRLYSFAGKTSKPTTTITTS